MITHDELIQELLSIMSSLPNTEAVLHETAIRAALRTLAHNVERLPVLTYQAPLRGFKDVIVAQTDVFEQWTMNLVSGATRTLGCRCYFVNHKIKPNIISYHALCREENIEVIRMLILFARETIRVVNTRVVAGRKFGKQDRIAFRLAFRLGMSERLREALLDCGEDTLAIEHLRATEQDDLEEWMSHEHYALHEYRPTQDRGDYVPYHMGILRPDAVNLERSLTHIPEAALERLPDRS